MYIVSYSDVLEFIGIVYIIMGGVGLVGEMSAQNY